LANQWIAEAARILARIRRQHADAARFAVDPNLPKFPTVYKMRSARCGLSYVQGRGAPGGHGHRPVVGESPADEFNTVRQNWDKYDFFFIHIKKTDSSGEDGNFDAKAHVIETVTRRCPLCWT